MEEKSCEEGDLPHHGGRTDQTAHVGRCRHIQNRAHAPATIATLRDRKNNCAGGDDCQAPLKERAESTIGPLGRTRELSDLRHVSEQHIAFWAAPYWRPGKRLAHE